MSRDYANRKPKGATKARNSRSKKAPQAQPMRIVPLIFVIFLVIGFGYFLWWIKGSSDDTVTVEPTAPVVIETPAAKPQVKDDNVLPPKPEETWTYQEALENKSVEVDIPQSDMVQVSLYQMQCGSFRKESQADELKALIAFQGMEAQVKRTEGSNGQWFKVVLGPFEGKRPAESSRHRLQNNGINGCKIWLWQ